MSDPKDTQKKGQPRDAELTDEQLEAASGGAPASKYKGDDELRAPKSAD